MACCAQNLNQKSPTPSVSKRLKRSRGCEEGERMDRFYGMMLESYAVEINAGTRPFALFYAPLRLYETGEASNK